MAVLTMTDSELLFSVAGVARMMNVPKEAVRDAIRHKRLRAETILIGDRIGSRFRSRQWPSSGTCREIGFEASRLRLDTAFRTPRFRS